MSESPPDEREEVVEFTLNLAFGESRSQVKVSAPNRPMQVDDLLPIIHRFDSNLVTLAEAEVQRQGRKISCRAGCGACCRQLVPVSEHEARRLARLVAAMPGERRRVIEQRFADALAELDRHGLLPGLADAALIPDEPTRAKLGDDYIALGIACPFLENESCDIYPDRPLVCREYMVTSPAENCHHPSPDTIQVVPVPSKLSETLYRFGDGQGRTPARWMALVLALRWAAEHQETPRREVPGPTLLREFLSQLSGK